MLLLFKLAALVTGLARVVPYVKNKLNEVIGGAEAAITAGCGWELYAFVIAATYAPVAPSSALLALIYLDVFDVSLNLELSNISPFPSDTN